MFYTQDSRQIFKNTVFIALVGENNDGHTYINQALKNGAKKIIFHDETYTTYIPKDKQIFVLDTEEWLWEQAKQKIKGAKVISICGSVGKTTTTKLLHHLITNTPNKFAKSVFTPRFGINTLRGICLEILNNYQGEKLVILETAMDSFRELDKAAKVFEPEYVAVVSIDISHYEKLKSMQRIIYTELGMLNSQKLKGAVVNIENPQTKKILKNLNLRYSLTKYTQKKSISKKLNINIEPPHFRLNLDITLEMMQLLKIKITPNKIQHALKAFTPAENRFELHKFNNLTVLNDCYNAAPLSYRAFFDFAKHQGGKKLGIIGQINEIGTLSAEQHELLFNQANKIFDEVIFVGEHFEHLKPKIFAKDWEQALDHYKKLNNARTWDFIGIKGSRGIQLEKVFECIKIAEKNIG